jgi:hypothetical protein
MRRTLKVISFEYISWTLASGFAPRQSDPAGDLESFAENTTAYGRGDVDPPRPYAVVRSSPVAGRASATGEFGGEGGPDLRVVARDEPVAAFGRDAFQPVLAETSSKLVSEAVGVDRRCGVGGVVPVTDQE